MNRIFRHNYSGSLRNEFRRAHKMLGCETCMWCDLSSVKKRPCCLLRERPRIRQGKCLEYKLVDHKKQWPTLAEIDYVVRSSEIL